MEVFLRRQRLEEEGEGRQAGSTHADGVRRHSALEQPGWRVPIDVALGVQQGMALVVVLPQERRRRPSAGVHRTPDRRGPGIIEEVGCSEEGQEQDLGPHRRHPHPKGEWPEEVGCHRSLPRKEGGTVDDTCAPAIHDGARCAVRWNDARRGGIPQL